MRELAKILKRAKQRGWYLSREVRHCIYKHKNGGCVTVSKTPSKDRALKGIENDFIREERLQGRGNENFNSR
jgi:predicted RNA binding protein YcfA (HicA-like mRNA interferase family)